MAKAPRKLVRIIAGFGVLLIVVPVFLFFGPLVIHGCYRSLTSEATIQKQRDEYRRLDRAESTLTGVEKAKSEKARDKLFLWFHARGYSIDEGDEGDEEYSLLRPWSELLHYWGVRTGE